MILTTVEAAKKYGLTQRYVRYLLERRTIAGRLAGGVWLVDEASLRRYLATERKPGPKPEGRRKSS